MLYVDGAPGCQRDGRDMTIGYDTNPVSLGRHDASYLNGRIDEAAIYKQALSAAEIASIYNAGPAGKRLLTAFEQWKLTYLGDFTAPDAGDPDGDGQSNLFEYVAGLMPDRPGVTFPISCRGGYGPAGSEECHLQSAGCRTDLFGAIHHQPRYSDLVGPPAK